MKSSSSSKKSRRTPPAPSSDTQYPSAWSAWEWIVDANRYERYRLIGPGRYEYASDRGETATEPRTVPTLPLDAIAELGGSPPAPQSNFTLSQSPVAISSLTRAFETTSLQSSQPSSNQQPQPRPAPQGNDSNHIRTRDESTDREVSNHNYRRHDSWEFKFGRVFKVLWSEPRGDDYAANNQGSDNASESEYSKKSEYTKISKSGAKGGEVRFEKIRRFVVVNPMVGHCICLPIMSYAGQGVRKRGVHAEHHTIIYTGKPPDPFPGEVKKGLTKAPIKVKAYNSRHKLDPASRLNYHKTYTVEHNVKVWFTGEVHADSHWDLSTDFQRAHKFRIRGTQPSQLPIAGSTSMYQSQYDSPATTSLSTTAPALAGINTFAGSSNTVDTRPSLSSSPYPSYDAGSSYSRSYGLAGSSWNTEPPYTTGAEALANDPLAGLSHGQYSQPSGSLQSRHNEQLSEFHTSTPPATSANFSQGNYELGDARDVTEQGAGQYQHQNPHDDEEEPDIYNE